MIRLDVLLSEETFYMLISRFCLSKRFLQMAALVMLLFSSGGAQENFLVEMCATGGPPLLTVAAFLTLYSLYEYLRGLWKYLV